MVISNRDKMSDVKKILRDFIKVCCNNEKAKIPLCDVAERFWTGFLFSVQSHVLGGSSVSHIIFIWPDYYSLEIMEQKDVFCDIFFSTTVWVKKNISFTTYWLVDGSVLYWRTRNYRRWATSWKISQYFKGHSIVIQAFRNAFTKFSVI